MGKWNTIVRAGGSLLGKTIEKASPRLASRFGSGLAVTDKKLVRYIAKSGEAKRFTVVQHASSASERKAVSGVLKDGNAVRSAGKGKQATLVYDELSGRTMSLRDAAREVRPYYARVRGQEYINKAAGVRLRNGEVRYTNSISPAYGLEGRVFDSASKSWVSSRNAYYHALGMDLKTYTGIRNSLTQVFGGRLGTFLANMYSRMFSVLSRSSAKVGTRTAERASSTAGEAAGEGAEKAARRGFFTRMRDSFRSRMSARQEAKAASAAEAEESRAAREINGYEKEIARYSNSSKAVPRVGENKYMSPSKGKEVSAKEALEEVRKISADKLNQARMRYVNTYNGKGRFLSPGTKKADKIFQTPVGRQAQKQGKVFWDAEKKEFVSAKEACSRLESASKKTFSEAQGAKAGEKAVENVSEKAKTAKDLATEEGKRFSVTPEMYDKIAKSPERLTRLRSIQAKGNAFDAEKKTVEEMRNAANSMTCKTAQDSAEKAKLIAQAAEMDAKIEEKMIANDAALSDLLKETNKSALRKAGQEILRHPKIYGWGGLGLYLYGHKMVTGQGPLGWASDLLSDRDSDGTSKGLAKTIVDDALGDGTTDKVKETAQTMTDKSAPVVVHGVRKVINGVEYVFSQAQGVWEGGKKIAEGGSLEAQRLYDTYVRNGGSSDGQGQSIATVDGNGMPTQTNPNAALQYDSGTNSWVYRDNGQYGDITDQNSMLQRPGTAGQVAMNAVNKATDYVTGKNLTGLDIAKLITTGYMTFIARQPIIKAAGIALGAVISHDINNRQQQQQQSQQQQQQTAQQVYNQYQQQADEAATVHRSL